MANTWQGFRNDAFQQQVSSGLSEISVQTKQPPQVTVNTPAPQVTVQPVQPGPDKATVEREAARRRIRNRLGQLREGFMFSRDFAVAKFDKPSEATAIDTLWTSYTVAWRAALD